MRSEDMMIMMTEIPSSTSACAHQKWEGVCEVVEEAKTKNNTRDYKLVSFSYLK